jgi:hypothetical protein
MTKWIGHQESVINGALMCGKNNLFTHLNLSYEKDIHVYFFGFYFFS